ncbi:MAG: AAA family ATPase [Intrasporangium sp.]|uniref:adenylate/guanylate cyclase domain-containing protein n=1 Tax=Intrasporangium sp. TaxID=1925024 RepID=UPI002647A304|nr:adenylate/guanylate cyclase domain-containing protein [Intrasporangium sp.]MDN5796822.1 AAA family ATPase [Intrasporangium sp.]
MAEYPLRAYVPQFALDWLTEDPDARHRRVEGSMAFVDIAGFTSLAERLTRLGVVGSEELSDLLSSTFTSLLDETHRAGADLIKWGGDAVLLLFQGEQHAIRAVRAAAAMRRTLYSVGRTRSSAGAVTLRMSVGVHSGAFDFFLVGDPSIHRELIVSGPAASRTAELEAAATAGQIAVGPSTAALLRPSAVAPRRDGLLLVRRVPSRQPARSSEGRITEPRRSADPGLSADPGSSAGPPKRAVTVSDRDIAGLLPPPVRAHLLAAAGESEHRPIAVAFVQFSGTDAVLDEQGPAGLAEALDEVVRNVQTACAVEQVTLLESDINRDGGKIMLVAGAPGGGEDLDARVLRVVRTVVDRAGVLPLRAGVNRGRVFAADFGPAFRRTYSVKGDAINVAARVMAHAATGQVLATREVVERAGAGFVLQPVEPFRVKGKTYPIQASLVDSTQDTWPEHGLRGGTPQTNAIQGRHAELAVIRDAVDRCRLGTPGVVEIAGAAGVGKSALLGAGMRLATGFTVLRGPSGHFGESGAHRAARRLLREVIGIAPTASASRQSAALLDMVHSRAPDLLAWVPLLGALLDLGLPPTLEVQDLDEEFRGGRQAQVFMDFLRASLRTPTLFLLDAAEQMDGPSVELIEGVLANRQDRPWLVLTTRRPGPGGLDLAGDPEAVRISLAPLDASASMAMLQSLTSDEPVSEHLLRAMVTKAGGNPLFLRALLETGRSGSATDLPDSIEAVIGGEIGRLSPRARTLLRFAAVLGERFSVADLAGLVRAQGWVVTQQDLRELGELIVQDGPVPTWLRFRTVLTRDVAYAGLPYRLRRRMHQRVGEVLEASAAELGTVSGALSTHFSEAGDDARAWTYSRMAADRARQNFLYPEALAFYQRAVESAARLDGLPAAEVATVLEEMGDVAELAGLSRDAVGAYRRARRWADADPLRLARVMSKEIRILHRGGAFTAALRTITRARALLTSVTGPEADAVASLLAVQSAFVRHLQARHADAVDWSRIAVEAAERSGDPQALAQAYNARGHILTTAGQQLDQPYSSLALAASERSGDLRMQAKCLNNLGIRALIDAEWELAEERYARAATLFRRVGDTAEEANTLYNQADLLIRQGRHGEAEVLLDASGRAARVVDDPELVALVGRELGKVRLGQGHLAQARHELELAKDSLERLGLVQEAVDAELSLLTTELPRSMRPAATGGNPASLIPAIEAIQQRAEAVGAVQLSAGVHWLRGAARLVAGEPAEARDAFALGASAPSDADGGHGRALNVLGLATACEQLHAAGPDRAGAERALTDFGVVSLPYPLRWSEPGPSPTDAQ